MQNPKEEDNMPSKIQDLRRKWSQFQNGKKNKGTQMPGFKLWMQSHALVYSNMIDRYEYL